MGKNELLPKINVEKNKLALEQAEATLKQLKATYDLKRRAAEADIRILQIRRDRSANAERQAETNAERMSIHAPIGGMAVVKTTWKGNNMADIQEGEEVRAGVPIVDIVNPNAMRVRARVNQADVNELKVGQAVRVGLDAYPTLFFDGRVAQISPLGVTSVLSAKVRNFIVLVDVNGSHPNLMPDLTASLDVTLARTAGAIVIPRDALQQNGDRTAVRVQRGQRFRGSRGDRRCSQRSRSDDRVRASTKEPSSPATCPAPLDVRSSGGHAQVLHASTQRPRRTCRDRPCGGWSIRRHTPQLQSRTFQPRG